jgi:hypothetical protein
LRVSIARRGTRGGKPERRVFRKRTEAYSLVVAPEGIELAAGDQAGIFYGLTTFLQLARDAKPIPCCRINDFPSLPIRGVHFDLKGAFPTVAYLEEAIRELAFYKINTILMEYEDKVLFERHPAVSHPAALAKEEWRKITRLADEHCIKIIPLQQSLGHVEYILRHKRYAGLAEHGHIQQLCPSDPGSGKLVADLIDEILDIHPDCRLFHIGGDEAYHLGACPRCARKNREDLYLEWIATVASILREKEKTPVIWDDMLRHMRPEKRARLKGDVTLMYWQYGPSARSSDEGFFEKSREYAHEGWPVVAAAGAKGVNGYFSNLGLFDQNILNIRQWTHDAVRFGFQGAVSTAWSRWSSLLPPCEVFETAWYPLIASAESFWTGTSGADAAFDRRFSESFLGKDCPEVVAAIRALNSMPPRLGHPPSVQEAAEETIAACIKKAGLNRRYLQTLILFSKVDRHLWNKNRLLGEFSAIQPSLARGKSLGEDFIAPCKKWARDIRNEARLLALEMRKLLKNQIVAPDIEELIETRLAYGTELMQQIEEHFP